MDSIERRDRSYWVDANKSAAGIKAIALEDIRYCGEVVVPKGMTVIFKSASNAGFNGILVHFYVGDQYVCNISAGSFAPFYA